MGAGPATAELAGIPNWAGTSPQYEYADYLAPDIFPSCAMTQYPQHCEPFSGSERRYRSNATLGPLFRGEHGTWWDATAGARWV